MDCLTELPVKSDAHFETHDERPHGERPPGGAQRGTDDRLSSSSSSSERTRSESKPGPERASGESRRAEKQWTLDRHAQRQIDRKLERQWTMGRHLDRSWSENRPTDIAIDRQWAEGRPPGANGGGGGGGRKAERPGAVPHLPQRPLPPYPSDWTPSPKQEGDPLRNLLAALVAAGERPQFQTQEAPSERHGQSDGCWRGGVGGMPSGRSAPCGSKPDPPPQSSKPTQLHRLSSGVEEEAEVDAGRVERKERGRDLEAPPPPIPEKPKTSSYVTFSKNTDSDRSLPPPPVPPPSTRALHGLPYRTASQGDEGMRPPAPVKPQRHRKAMSCDTGNDRDSPINLEKPTNRKPPPGGGRHDKCPAFHPSPGEEGVEEEGSDAERRGV
ncbi:hypothetical protein CRUP_024210 [Coryphaenoides rupestris]|nr:hypothetical protein CRUP_024210 [Coryphaenoides rupestris]